MSTLRDAAESNPVVGDMSQFGEGAMISMCLERLGIAGGVVVEFGAGDGVHLSNTAHLTSVTGGLVLFAESDFTAALDLAENYVGVEGVRAVAFTVTPDNVNDLVPLNADVVSIDVDGDDYDILCAMKARPSVLCVEHNPMIPAHVSMVAGTDIGCSALALKDWSDWNGYTVVGMTHCNTIMVPTEHASRFGYFDTDFSHMFDPSGVTWALSNVKTGDYTIHGPWPFGRGDEQ